MILSIIAQDKTLITYRPKLNELTGSITATILLQQIMYWWDISGNKEFYKFKAPCKHPDYKEGDSWTESLGMTIYEFDSAYKKLKELDRGGVFEKDDEVGVIFQSILKIQEILNEFNLRKFS